MNTFEAEAVSQDAFLGGRLQIKQYLKGYRFAIDAVLLAHHVRPGPCARILDLGTGCGIVALILACRFPDSRLWAIEIQPALAALAAENVHANGLADQIGVINADLRDFALPPGAKGVDWVVCNPPFRRVESGRINPVAQKAVAMHEIEADAGHVVAAAKRILKPAGELLLIYPADRIVELMLTLRTADIEPKGLRWVHARRQDEARRVLIHGVKHGRPGLKVVPPLMISRAGGGLSDEVRKMMGTTGPFDGL